MLTPTRIDLLTPMSGFNLDVSSPDFIALSGGENVISPGEHFHVYMIHYMCLPSSTDTFINVIPLVETSGSAAVSAGVGLPSIFNFNSISFINSTGNGHSYRYVRRVLLTDCRWYTSCEFGSNSECYWRQRFFPPCQYIHRRIPTQSKRIPNQLHCYTTRAHCGSYMRAARFETSYHSPSRYYQFERNIFQLHIHCFSDGDSMSRPFGRPERYDATILVHVNITLIAICRRFPHRRFRHWHPCALCGPMCA